MERIDAAYAVAIILALSFWFWALWKVFRAEVRERQPHAVSHVITNKDGSVWVLSTPRVVGDLEQYRGSRQYTGAPKHSGALPQEPKTACGAHAKRQKAVGEGSIRL